MNRRFLRCLISTLLVFMYTSALTLAQPTGWTLNGPAFSATAAEIQTAAARISAEPFTEATVFSERDAFSLDSAGRESYRHTLLMRIETQEGVKHWSEIRVVWEPWHQQTPEIHARVIAPDGKVTLLDQQTITDGPASANGEDTYTDARVRKVPLPAVAIGSIVEQETVSTDKEPAFSGGMGLGNSFSWSVPMHHGELRIDVPKDSHFRIKILNLPEAKIKDEVVGDVRHYTLEQGYVAGMVESDIPLSTHIYIGHGSRFSTGESWASVAEAYRKMAEPSIEPPKVKAILPKPGATRQETIARIVAALHKAVRYTGIEFGQASLQPTPAAEVLKRHYGDCKDKAALLVSMLRAVGIDANLALLNTGPGIDIDPELPGMQFDHAIVYLPAVQGAEAQWIDATAEYGEVGTLPIMDAGRQALIIGEASNGLTLTPQSKPDDDLLIEEREIVMADYGASKITETSLSHGPIDSSYRYLYGDDLTREQKEDLEKYAKNSYQAKNLVSITHGDAHSFTKPFALKLEMTEAKRGDTGLDDAVLSIPFTGIFYRLAEWFRTDPETDGVQLTPQQEENRKRARSARMSEYDSHPFATEWHYTITPPEGFVVRALPADKSTAMGPATLVQKFERSADGKVRATLRFENPKTRLTTDEAVALRDAVLAAYKLDSIPIWFDQSGSKLMADGKIREALAADRALIAQSPNKSIHHAQIAYVYLKASQGALARKEAREAVRLDPKASVNHHALGIICEYNDLGLFAGPGFDWKCANDALKKAADLDADNTTYAADLALLQEYDSHGDRYTATAPLKDGITLFEALKQKDKSAGEKYQDNILYDLFYSGRYKELLDEINKLSMSPNRRGLSIAATTALQGGTSGVTAGIECANRIAANAAERTASLTTAGNLLMHARLYPEMVGILSTAVEGQQDSSTTAANIALARDLKQWTGNYLPASDPRSALQRFVLDSYMGSFNQQSEDELMARNGFATDEEWHHSLENIMQSRNALHARAENSGLTPAALMDFIAGHLKLTSEGDDETGYRMTSENIGQKTTKYFVTRDQGLYRVLAGEGSQNGISGNYLLYLLKQNRDKEARALLDWVRDSMHKGGGDDPLSGELLPRFWTVGDPADKNAMKWAAIAQVVDSRGVLPLIPEIRKAWEDATDPEARLNYALLLATAYRTAQDTAHLREIANEILKKYPESYNAISFTDWADTLDKTPEPWKLRIEAQLAKHPSDEVLTRMKVNALEALGDWNAARTTLQTLETHGKATAEDYNRIGLISLAENKATEDAIKASRQGNTLTQNANFAQLQTLASLYALQGKTNEARDLLVKTMRFFNMTEPNDSMWYLLGLLYENYGSTDAALDAYAKVKKPIVYAAPTSTWILAQNRIKALHPGTANPAGN